MVNDRIRKTPIPRREILKVAAAMGGMIIAADTPGSVVAGATEKHVASGARLLDVPLSNSPTITVERRGHIALLGLNRPHIQNRLDSDALGALGRAYYQFDRDPSLRAAVLFGHGPQFSRGIDGERFKTVTREPLVAGAGVIDPLGKQTPFLSKPLITVSHGDTWNLGHQIFLMGDIRVASIDTEFGQDEAFHGHMLDDGATERFVHEVGLGNAMRYILTGDHWTAYEALRMGSVQALATSQKEALRLGIRMAEKVAACEPVGIQASLRSAHLVLES